MDRQRKNEIIFLVIVISILLLSIFALVFISQNNKGTTTPTATSTTTFTPQSTSTRTSTVTRTTTPSATSTRTATITLTPSVSPLPSQTPTQFVFDQGDFEQMVVFQQVIPGVINRFMVADDGSFWLASPYAVGRYQPLTKQFNQINLRDPVIALTRDGIAWILPKSGTPLSTWDGSLGRTYDQTTAWLTPQGYGLPSPLAPQISYDHNQDLWLTTAYDVRRLRGDQWRIFLPQEMTFTLPYRKTLSTSFVISHSQVDLVSWVGSCNWSDGVVAGGDGLRIYQENDWHLTELPVASGCVHTLANDPDGHLWVAIEKQLWRFDEIAKTWQQWKPPALDRTKNSDFAYGQVKQLKVDLDGSLWVLYALCGFSGCDDNQILYQIRDDKWYQRGESSFLQPPLLLFAAKNSAWSLVPGEINRYLNGTWKTVAKIGWIGADVDANGNLWLLTGDLTRQLQLWRYQP